QAANPVSARPEWLHPWVQRALRRVPYYRRYGGWAGDLEALPTIDRGDLTREVWSFVPDDQALDSMVVYYTSGTTASKLWVMAEPAVSSKYLVLLRRAMALHGVRLEGHPAWAGPVSVAMVSCQQETLTYPCTSLFLGGAGFVKLNLNPASWRHPADRERFLDHCNPEVYTGNPLAFQELARLDLSTRPKALMSTAMALSEGLRASLEEGFGCPVLDVYSMCECRMLAVKVGGVHQLLANDVHVEVLDESDRPVPAGERGEVTLTGGRNPFMPLLRYRTGDHAALALRGQVPVLVGLEGRQPVVFVRADGSKLNNIDVTTALQDVPVARYHLHQAADRSLRLEYCGDAELSRPLSEGLDKLFPGLPLTVDRTELDSRKMLRYTSEAV
ncbi:MAG: AMP-binding protein, partial [Candidatus Eremiobacterota bacterium]